ncbi:MAG: hypothetical protein RLW62_21520 [Gammaproteobacteria bacterium]
MARQPRHGVRSAELAAIAARALADGSARDFNSARERAARELGVALGRDAPDNRAIHQALIDYLGLFQRVAQERRIARLRRAALAALALFEPFAAKLCGPVWYGTAAEHDPIVLHLTADEPEAVTRFLLERRIPYHLGESLLRFPGQPSPHRTPCFELELDGELFELAVFPSSGPWRQPLSSLDERPVRRVGRRELAALIDAGTLFVDAPDSGPW